MINIEEREPKQVPGLTSMFIKTAYNPELVKFFKSLSCKYWNKNTKEWEFPHSEIPTILDTLVTYDSVEFKCLKDKKEKKKKEVIKTKYKIKPLPHQIEGIEYGLNHDKWLLLDLPGCGKTLQAAYLAQELKEQRGIKHCLVICGINSIKWNWVKELQKTTNLSCTILGQKRMKNGKLKVGSVEDRLAHLKSKIKEFFIITNIETLRDKDIQKAFKKGVNEIDMIIFDEIHCSKNSASQQGKGVLALKDCKYKLGMTGTLLLNNPIDLYMPLKWIGVERSALSVFKSNYCVLDQKFGKTIVGYKNIDMLAYIRDKFSIRRSIELPVMQIIPEYIEMNSAQDKFYDNLEHGIIDQVDKVTIKDTTMLLSIVTRLRQATACPSILTTESIKSSKIERAIELTDQILSNNEKVVIFSTFKETVYELANLLKDKGCVIATGDQKDEEVSEAIDRFQEDNTVNIFIGTWQKCGTGVTLNKARYLIFIDQPWTYGLYDQCCKRIHRIGTNKPTFVYNIICKDTIDERVWEIINDKKALSDYIVDDILNDSIMESLKKYIIDLIDFKNN